MEGRHAAEDLPEESSPHTRRRSAAAIPAAAAPTGLPRVHHGPSRPRAVLPCRRTVMVWGQQEALQWPPVWGAARAGMGAELWAEITPSPQVLKPLQIPPWHRKTSIPPEGGQRDSRDPLPGVAQGVVEPLGPCPRGLPRSWWAWGSAGTSTVCSSSLPDPKPLSPIYSNP